MKLRVTEQGVLIPPELLGGADEVEVRRENGVVVVTPVSDEDPILGLGKNPVKGGHRDAAENHDRYIYGR